MSYKVEPHPKSGIFRMLGTVDGKRVRKSLKTRDLKSAELLAAKEAARLIRESYFGKEAEATISDAYIKWAEDRSLREGQRDHMSANMQPILPLGRRGEAERLYAHHGAERGTEAVSKREASIVEYDGALPAFRHHKRRPSAWPLQTDLHKALQSEG